MVGLQIQIYIRPSCLRNNAIGLHVLCIFKSKSLDHFHSTVIKLLLIPEHSSLQRCSAWQVI